MSASSTIAPTTMRQTDPKSGPSSGRPSRSAIVHAHPISSSLTDPTLMGEASPIVLTVSGTPARSATPAATTKVHTLTEHPSALTTIVDPYTILATSSEQSSPTQSTFLPAAKAQTAGWADLRRWAETYNDAQLHRISVANRFGIKADGTEANVGLTVAADLHESGGQAFIDELKSQEAKAGKILARTLRRVVPKELQRWIKASNGIGEQSIARLLGTIGDPYIATPLQNAMLDGKRVSVPNGEPYVRSIAQLRAFCGVGAPSRKRKGMTQDELMDQGKPMAKKLLYLLASNAIKEGGRSIEKLLCGEQSLGATWHYRAVYEERRLDTIEKCHATECVRCGPSGKPAQPGSPWSDAHKHADGLRIVAKEILADMWLARRDAMEASL